MDQDDTYDPVTDDMETDVSQEELGEGGEGEE